MSELEMEREGEAERGVLHLREGREDIITDKIEPRLEQHILSDEV